MSAPVRIGRIYDAPSSRDGARVLVDRIWPRGVRKADARLDAWARDVAPSHELRRWYGHDPAKFTEFRRRYAAELSQGPARAALDGLRALLAAGPVTLLTATRDVEHSQAAVLAGLLQPPEGGEAACWAHLVCPDCGAIVTEGHQPGCPAGDPGARSARPGRAGPGGVSRSGGP
ncbi:MAG: DUF488 domain-containing protein [Streptosporangiales bacterium]